MWMELCMVLCVFLSLAGQYTIDLSDDCGQLSQTEHRGHHSVIMADLKKKDTGNFTFVHPSPFACCVWVCVWTWSDSSCMARS